MKPSAALFLLSCAARAHIDPLPGPTFPHAFPFEAVYGVQVRCPQDEPGRVRGGTAFAIGMHDLITAKHVVACNGHEPESVKIKHVDSDIIYSVEVKKFATTDVARLYARADMQDWIEVHLQTVSRGAQLCFVTANNFTKCGFSFSGTKQPFIGIAIPAVAGNSGSPVIDQGGHVVAVVVGTTEIKVDDGQEAATFSISAESWFIELM